MVAKDSKKLCRFFLHSFSFFSHRNNIRMQHAIDFLQEEKLSINEISNLIGFSSPAYFSSAFKQKYGVSPKRYKLK
ncbi:MAG: helix-turn-helix transcriptional regulator [Clostridia bacterium]|nr:helix-turn-helix transcriptional regulator [Clostridia bacterium]